MDTTTKTISPAKTNFEHLRHHVKYPATREQLLEACNGMSDVNEADKGWFAATLPPGTYRTAEDVVRTLLAKV